MKRSMKERNMKERSMKREVFGVQGDSDISVLTPFGEEQAVRTNRALSRMPFDR